LVSEPDIHARSWLLAGAAALPAAVMVLVSWESGPTPAFWFWLGACLATELLWVRLPMGGVTLSMASCCNFAALLLLSRGEAMLVAIASVFAAELLFVRKPMPRVVFNAAQTGLAVGCASLLISGIGGSTGQPLSLLSAWGLLALLLGACAYFLINTSSVSLAVALTEKRSILTVWKMNYAHAHKLQSNVALFSLAYVAAIVFALAGAGVTACVLLLLVLADRAYQRHIPEQSDKDTEIRPAA
jgi:hypothetical protein